MKDIMNEIEYKGKKYKIVFNLNVMDLIQDKYETVQKWGELTDGSKGEPNIKALKYGFTCMLNEGIEIDNENNGTDEKLLTEKQVGRIISEIGLEGVANKLSDTVVSSTQSAEKNA